MEESESERETIGIGRGYGISRALARGFENQAVEERERKRTEFSENESMGFVVKAKGGEVMKYLERKREESGDHHRRERQRHSKFWSLVCFPS